MTDADPNLSPPQQPLDLTPRQVPAQARTGSRRWRPLAVLILAIGGLGFVLFQTLGDAALFFYNADEAVERRDDLVDQRFRVQGTPFGEPFSVEVYREDRQEIAVVFPIKFEGSVIDVVHFGTPAEIFQPGVPVVLEGTWVQGLPVEVEAVPAGANDGWHFSSTDMVVKHDNEYRTDNSDRLDEADRGGFSPET